MRRSERHEHERSDSAARAKLLLMARKEFHAFFRWRVVRVRSFCEAKAIRSRASRLCGEAERGYAEVRTYASVTARPFFEGRGYSVVRKIEVIRRGVALENYLMIRSFR